MTLNSSDYERLRNPVGESEAAPEQPSELELLRRQQQELVAKLATVEQREQDTSNKFRRYMDDANKRQDILRQEIERRALSQPAPTAPAQKEPAPSQEGGSAWMDLLGINLEESKPVADDNSQNKPRYYTEEDIDRRIEEKQRAAKEAEYRQQQELQSKIVELRKDFQERHSDIATNPKLQEFFANTVNEINQISPNTSVEDAYKLALTKTRQAMEMFSGGAPPKQQSSRQAPPANPYLLPNQQQAPRPRQQDNIFSPYIDNMSESDVREQRKKEIEKQRKDHLAKFIR